VVFDHGKRVGHNTDWFGFSESLRRGLPDIQMDSVLQVGTGGAGAAVAFALLSLGAGTLFLNDLDPGRAEELAAKMADIFPGRSVEVVGDLAAPSRIASGFVNASPVGMDKYPGSPIAADLLRPDLWVADVVYVPLQTQLLTQAQALGCRTLDGGGMAVFQAAEAFRHFTGRQPDADRMRRDFLRDLAI
jgi:shikimate dehydrogenase